MKRSICLLMALVMLLGLCACGQKPAKEEATEWTRQGYYMDEDENFLSVTWMDDVVEPGWYVGFMDGEDLIEDSYGGILPQEGMSLHGSLPSGGSSPAITVTVSEEGEDGLLLQIEGGESYHFLPADIPEATIFVAVNVEGWGGNIAYEEGESAPETESPIQSAQINLAEPAIYTMLAWPDAGNLFVKWTRNGEDFSTQPQITVLLDESASYTAVFEEDPAWQNPVMNFIGEYQSGAAHAQVMCFGYDEAWITIEQPDDSGEVTRWLISGRLDTETLRIDYTGSNKAKLVLDDEGEIVSEETEYEDGSGTITFNDDGGFTWHTDQAADPEDMVFAWSMVTGGEETGMANPWREVTEAEAVTLCPKSFVAPAGAENLSWSVMDTEEIDKVPEPLVQLCFDLDGFSFTAREQATGDEERDLSGLYYEWTAEREESMKNWADGNMTARLCRYVGDDQYVDLCTWYDIETGVSYSLSVIAEDLDGFDLLAVADMLCP